MSLYAYSEYRPALKWLLGEKKRTTPGLTQAKLAEAVGVHSTYITNVFKERAEFSSDQLFLISRFLNLPNEESNYLVLLLEYSRTGIADRKKELKKQIEEIQKKHLDASQRLKVQKTSPDDLLQMQFYLDPIVSVVQLALKLPRYSSNIEALATDLGLPQLKIGEAIELLQNLGKVSWDPKTKAYQVHQSESHLPKTHPLCMPHQELLRMQSVHHIAQKKPDYRESFMSTFVADAEVVKALHDAFLDFAESGGKRLQEVERPDGVYQLNFDLFKWTR